MLQWCWKRFDDLSNDELYAVLCARQEVFVLEQRCFYSDLDGLDKDAWHLLGFSTAHALVAYLRVLPPGRVYAEPAVGRVLTVQSARSQGVGKALMTEGIQRTRECYPNCAIRISAQDHLRDYYADFGFMTAGDVYVEDGIPHIEMLLDP